MNRIVVIGNGYDIAIGLKTSYKDFLEYAKVEIKYNSFIEHLVQVEKEQGWFDFEREMGECLYKILSGDKNIKLGDIDKIASENGAIFNFIKNRNKDYSDERRSNKLLCCSGYYNNHPHDEYYKACCKESCEIHKDSKNGITIEKRLLINLNYTDTCRNLMTENLKFDDGQLGFHLHGSISTNKILIGYNDLESEIGKSLWESENKDIIKYIKKFDYSLNHRKFKIITDFIDDGEYKVSLFGVSCGVSDKFLWKTLLGNKNCKGYFICNLWCHSNGCTDNKGKVIESHNGDKWENDITDIQSRLFSLGVGDKLENDLSAIPSYK
jgi:hypothetical protein